MWPETAVFMLLVADEVINWQCDGYPENRNSGIVFLPARGNLQYCNILAPKDCKFDK